MPMNLIKHDQVPVGPTAVGLTLPVRASNGETYRPRRALIAVTDNPIRWRADGTAPGFTVGTPVSAGSYIDWTDSEYDYDAFQLIKRVKFIQADSASGPATLEVDFFD